MIDNLAVQYKMFLGGHHYERVFMLQYSEGREQTFGHNSDMMLETEKLAGGQGGVNP